jgi:hypothetical protein
MPVPIIAPATSFVVVATRFVATARKGGEPPHYEIVLGADQDPDTPQLTLVTFDETAIGHALRLEGSDTRVTVTWRRELSPRGRPRLRLDSLALQGVPPGEP